MALLVHVTRNGTPLGQFRRDQIRDLIEAGTVLETDTFFDEVKREWLPLTELKTPTPFVPAPPREVTESGDEEESIPRQRRRRSGRSSGPDRKRHKRNPAESSLPGWIVSLFAIGIAAGLWAWAQSLRDQLRISEEKVLQLTESVSSLQRHNSILLEMAPPRVVRGVLTTEPSACRLAVLSGVSVSVFPLDDVRRAILRVINMPNPVTEEELSSILTTMQAGLPPPLSMTLSDSSGRFELALPEPGSYAIVATAFRQSGGSNERLVWLIELESSEEPTPVVSLNEKNAVSLRTPGVKLAPARR
jgi:hypothetical protein